ncbi:MAG: hypothetical protein JO249_19785 [Acidobacteria bacterium]|nr:hypothetical protein [Acidobacteriota bacterium]
MATALYYFAAWTDSHCLLGCLHQHETIISAVACCTTVAGSYVVAVESGQLRELDEGEEAEFQYAMYGWDTRRGRYLPAVTAVLAFVWRFAGYRS